MENIGLNNEVAVGGKSFHIQTQYLEPSEKVVSNIFDSGKVIFTRAVDVQGVTATSEIKRQVNRLHQDMTSDLELIFYIAEKVNTIRHAGSNNKLGIVFLTRNLFDEAITEFKKAIEADPDYVEAYNNLGYALIKKKQYQEASEVLVLGLEKDGNYADLHNNLGYAFAGMKKYSQAITQLTKAIEINEHYVIAILNLCIVYLKSVIEDYQGTELPPAQHRIEKARELLNRVRTGQGFLKPEQIDAILAQLENNNYPEAVAALEMAIWEFPELLDRYLESEFYLKFMFGGKGKDDEFIRDYTNQLIQSIEQYPEYADLRNHLGIAYLIQCRNLFLNALEEFRQALRINPDFKKAEKNLKLAENDGKGFLILLRAILK